jgi:hypothetical protein
MWNTNSLLYIVYLIFLELSPVLAYIYSWLSWHPNVSYVWAGLCLNYAGCKVIFLEHSHMLGFYELNGCLFLSTRADEDEDLYTTAIDTYVTDGWALTLTPYSYFSHWWHNLQIKNDLATTLAISDYNNVIVYPIIFKEGRSSLYISAAWEKQMSIQIILTHNKELVLDMNKREANHGIKLYCYRSEVIRPAYFNTFEEFAEYVKLIWQDAHEQLKNALEPTEEPMEEPSE